jgi:hypothetical protein
MAARRADDLTGVAAVSVILTAGTWTGFAEKAHGCSEATLCIAFWLGYWQAGSAAGTLVAN